MKPPGGTASLLFAVLVCPGGAENFLTYTLALYPGRLGRGETPDAAKVIRLDSMFSGDKGKAGHMLLDLTPGDGKFEGKAVLTLHFGSLFLAGTLG